jgi:hypothetical protein
MEEKENQLAEDVVVQENFSPAIIYQQDKAFIDMQIATAKAYPRNIRKATENSVAVVTMDFQTAESCNYSVPRGNKSITGPSVHLAKIIAQFWGNMRIEAKVVGVDQTHVTSEAVCWDLESNLAIKVQVKRSIIGKYGRYNDDMITVTGNAANAIALRNGILHVIPKGVVDKVYKAAVQTITGDVSTETKLLAKRTQVVNALKDEYGVTEKEILAAIGKSSLSHITKDDLVTLIGIGTAIKEGDTSIEDAFRKGKDAPVSFDDVQSMFDLKKDKLSEKEMKDAKRIIDNKEENSYSKLLKLLQSK